MMNLSKNEFGNALMIALVLVIVAQSVAYLLEVFDYVASIFATALSLLLYFYYKVSGYQIISGEMRRSWLTANLLMTVISSLFVMEYYFMPMAVH